MANNEIETQYNRLRALASTTLAAHPAIEADAKKRREDLTLPAFPDAIALIEAGKYHRTHLGVLAKNLSRYTAANFGALAAAARGIGDVMSQHINGKPEHAAYNLAKVVTPALDKAER